ncbi:hypothetical protein GPJ59_21435 [Streptomyces bambusae]|uniref:Secreted protein n=1 Tax=Streptomyces bambusae TaxID=1550616 RepID=A0ABS6Z9C1_9ACTN|nr:hypothetical protein [Streptomyces bambusae]
MRPSLCLCVPVVASLRANGRNDTSEITNVWIRGSQAEICYWAPYSLCGTKPIQKVFISPKIVTHALCMPVRALCALRASCTSARGDASAVPRGASHPFPTRHPVAGLRFGHGSGVDHIPVTKTAAQVWPCERDIPGHGLHKPFSGRRDRMG